MTANEPGPAPAPLPIPTLPAGGISSWVIGRIRTAVPMAVGVALTFGEHEFASRFGFAPQVDGTGLDGLAVFAVSYGYYELVRRLERWKPALGWLLGYPAQPSY